MMKLNKKNLFNKIVFPLSLIIFACEEEPELWAVKYGAEGMRIYDTIVGKKYIFESVLNEQQDDLLAGEYQCLKDDTFSIYYDPMHYKIDTLHSSTFVNIQQGTKKCWDVNYKLILDWGIGFTHSGVDLFFPVIINHPKLVYDSKLFTSQKENDQNWYELNPVTGKLTLSVLNDDGRRNYFNMVSLD